MGTDLTTAAGQAVAQSTPEGATALRLISSSGAWRVDDADDLKRWLSREVLAALPAAIVEAHAMLAPALGSHFREHMTPSLVLVAPGGWTKEQSVAWQAAAARELSGIPADLLAIGCAAARQKADHPSKIIPEIHKAVRSRWDARQADLARLKRIDDIAAGRRSRKPWEPDEDPDVAERCTPEQAAEILRQEKLAFEDRPARPVHDGPPRKPTRADYIALGVAPEALAQMGITSDAA